MELNISEMKKNWINKNKTQEPQMGVFEYSLPPTTEEWARWSETLADATKQEMHACTFFKNANEEQCGKPMESVENQLALGTDNFPKTIAKAHEASGNCRQCQPKKQQQW